MNSYKQEIAVSDVVANDGNPRRDFGDLEALAASIRAGGGQPFTPIIVVPDGSHFRLVDGERRWRAMRELGTERCDALVFPTMGEAEAAVAMMATDDSKALDQAERMRGFQSMMALGVDDEVAAALVGTDAARVRRMRRVAKEAPEQATLDALIAAADDEFSEEERARILGGHGPYGDPQAEADRIRRAHERERRMGAIRTAMPDGVDFRPGEKPWSPERDGLIYVRTVRDAKAAARLAAQLDGEADVVAYEDGIGYAVYRTAGEGALDPAEAERARVRRVRDEHAQAYAEAYREMCLWATEPWCVDDMASRHRTPASRRPNLCEAVIARRCEAAPWSNALSAEARAYLGVAATVAEDEDPSLMEVCCWLQLNHNAQGLLGWSGDKPASAFCADFVGVYDTLLLDGYKPSEGAAALRDMCPEKEAEE